MTAAPSLAAGYLKNLGVGTADVGIILGTGLHQLTGKIRVLHSIPYAQIPGFSKSTVESHKGQLLYGLIEGKKIIALQGRFHYYEGYSYDQIVFPVRVMHALGVKKLLVSNAAGALHPAFRKGELMQLTSHLDFQKIAPALPNPAQCYQSDLNTSLQLAAAQEKIKLHRGIYAAVSGPQLETRAEYRYLRLCGADAVGMSTVPEVVAAHLLQMACVAVSVLTDECDPDNLKPVTLEEIIAVASAADNTLTRLFMKTIAAC